MAQPYSSIKEAGVSPTRNLIWNPSQWDTSIWEDNDFNASGGTLDKRCFSNIVETKRKIFLMIFFKQH